MPPSMAGNRRVGVTGLGFVTPIGNDLETVWSSLVEGVSGVSPITHCDTTGYSTKIAAEVKGFEPEQDMDRKTARHLSRYCQFALAAPKQVVASARADPPEMDPDAVGAIVATGGSGLDESERNCAALLQRGPRGIAVMFMLEELECARARGASVPAEVVGYGASADMHHFTAPHPEAAGAVRPMCRALAKAAIGPGELGYVNAHGTATRLGDVAETKAIRHVVGERADTLPVSATKSVHAHLMGAPGAMEAAVCVLAIDRGVIPPTIKQDYQDPQCDLDYVPNRAREAQVDVALSNSFGFGGHNATLVFPRPPDA